MGIMIKRIAAIAVGAMVVMALGGCLSTGSSTEDANQKIRNYMSQINQIMVDLDEGLAEFTDAVSRDDAVNMESQLAQAMKTLDKLDALEVPDGLGDVQAGYKNACATLKSVMQDYVDLYQEMTAAGESVDVSSYAQRLQAIQERYDAGVDALEAADAAAAKATAAASEGGAQASQASQTSANVTAATAAQTSK